MKTFTRLTSLVTALLFVLLLCSAAGAVQFASVTVEDNGLALSYIEKDSAGKFVQTSEASLDVTPLGRAYLYSFTHNNEPRLLLAEVDGTSGAGTSKARIYVYNPSDLSEPLASGELPYAMNVQHVTEFNGHILLAGECNPGVILEVNPETCDVVSSYTFNDTTDGALIAVNDGKIYAYYENLFKLEEMSSLGTVTKSADIGQANYYLSMSTVSGDVYYSNNLGLYMLDTDTDLTYKTIVEATYVSDFCGDGSNGFYYVISEENNQAVYHYNGQSSEKVYDYDLEGAMDYDTDSKVLSFCNNGSYPYVQMLLLDGATLPITSETLDNYLFSAYGSTAKVLASSSSENGSSEGSEASGSSGTTTTSTATPVSVESLSDTTVSNIVSNVSGISSSADIKTVTTVKEAVTASSTLTTEIKNDGYEIASASSVLNVTEAGWYLVSIAVPSSLQGLTASNFKIYLVNTTASVFGTSALADGITEATALNTDGSTFTQVPSSILVASNLESAGDYAMYLAKASGSSSSMGSSSSGCNAGFAALSILLPLAVLIKKRK